MSRGPLPEDPTYATHLFDHGCGQVEADHLPVEHGMCYHHGNQLEHVGVSLRVERPEAGVGGVE